MYANLLAFSLFMFLAVSFSAFGQAAKKDKNNKNDGPIAKININTVTESLVNGRVSSSPSGKSIVVQIPFQKIVKNNKGNNSQAARAHQKQAIQLKNSRHLPTKHYNSQAARAHQKQAIQLKNSRHLPTKHYNSQAARSLQRQKQAIQLQNSQHLVTTWKELEIPITEKTKFRQMHLAEAFDDKGTIKKYTADELKTLKGTDSKLPGYEVKAEDILPGQVVRVNLARSVNKDGTSPYATMVIVVGKDNSYKPANNSDKKAKAK